MEKDLNNKEFYNDMLKEMVKYITVSKTEMSVMQTADAILHEYIKRTEHHIWLVNQCAGILKDVLVENGQDVSEFMACVEYHDYDKLHNPKIIPVYAVACDYYYGEGKKNYEVYEEALHNEFEMIAWPEHHRANVHHVAEHYGKRDSENKPFIVPPTQDYLAIGEMIADWMAMSITHGDSAREWYKKTKGVKWTFEPIDEKIIEKFLKAEDEANNQLAYLRQFKTWEASTVAMQQAPTISEEDPQETNGVNEGIENFYREYENAEDKDLNDILLIEPIEQENLVEDDDSELDKYIQEVSKLVSQMEPMELKHKLGKYEDDELAIGKISDKNINMDIVNELMKYPKYLEVLKHWITVPDYTLLPDLARFGAIIDKIYKLDKPIVAYRGMRVGLVKSYKAQNEMGLVITEDGGMNDDGVEMVLKTPKSGVTEGYNFDYTIEGPLSVSRSIWITKIYGNLIVKTVIPPTARKLVITNELAYILQKLEARYFNYRPMNLSSRTEIILFPNQTFNFEVVTTNGDISEELSELHEVFYNLQEDTKEVVAGSENSIGHEAFCDQLLDTKSCEVVLPFVNTNVYKQITDLAKPCYKPIGQNSWEHIQQVYSQASRICKKLFNRTLTPVEYAACLFHDCSVIDSGKENHNQLSADKAVGILKDLFTPEELNIIHTAIVEHDNQVTSGQWKFSSSASEFVAAGDFNPPDAEWIMNKSYTWGITHGLDHAERITNMTALVKRAYSSTGEMWLHMPNAYKNYFATKINSVKKLFDKITPEEAEKIVMAYRKKHHLSDTDINLPVSSVEMLKFYGDFANTSEKRTIKQLVDKYYDKVGSHGWNHISEVLATAEKLVKRTLTLVEYTAIVCHDLARKEMDEGHPARSVEIAKKILPGTNLFSTEELKEIYKAIGAHGNKHEFASELCELVACADRCFPKTTIEDLYERPILWMLEGSDKGKPTEKEYDVSDDLSIATRAVSQIKKWCGDIYDKAVKEDNLYTRTFKNDLKKTQDLANNTKPEQVVPVVKKLRSSFSIESLSTKEYTEADINSVKDLKQFYKHCSYGLIDFKANKPWKETHKNTTFEDWEKEWRLLTVEQLLKFKCGICYDTAKANDYFLTKWKIDHVNLFAYTKRSAGDDYDDDPTHTFTVYKDTDGKWKWLEGSWGSFKNNDWSESSSDALIKNIGKALANAAGVTNLIGVITSWPRDGVSMNEFYHALKDQAIKRYKYEIKPDVSYSKEALSDKEYMGSEAISIPTYNAMYNKQQIVSIVNRIRQNPAGNNCQRHAIAFVLAVRNNEYPRFEDVTSPFDIVFDTIINKAFEFKNWFISKSVECQNIQSIFDRQDPFIAIVSVKWKKGNGGHVFNVIRIDNETYVVDCQEKKIELASKSKHLNKNVIDYNNSFVLDMTHTVLDRELIDISLGLSNRKFFLNDNGPYTSIIEGLAKLDTANTTYTVSMDNTVIGRIRCDIRTNENYNFIDCNSPENRVYYVYKYHWESCNIPSSEALSPDVKKKKQLIIDYICSICDIIDPSKLNSKRYHRLLDNMNDKEFDQWMHYVKEGKWRLHIVAPNLIINLKNENLLKAADKAKCKLFHRIWMTDHATGRQYLTDNEYLVLTLPVRRQQQFLDEKMSVPDNDRQIDGMTGQVTGDSRSSSITNPEIQILASRKLDATLEELVNVRGGNMLAYGEFKRQAEETGEINMTMFDPNTRSRVAVVGQVLLNSMMIDTNIVE